MGTKGIRTGVALTLCLLVPLTGTTGCAYDYPDPARTPTAKPDDTATTEAHLMTVTPRQPPDPQVLGRGERNYQDLKDLLGAVPGPTLLREQGPLDGPERGFGGKEQVSEAGEYTVTAACIGAPNAKIFIRQENPTVTLWPVELTVDCPGTASEIITLQQGYVSAHLSLPPSDETPWTGAVGGVLVTGS
ncbi:hypothetical protein AB0284_10955 [Pseudarthrobacter phenanthrenivorans]|uniref:hypothetical protein n=1 Tax=Pseudarthrobacter phenanthrenivorans TaxID=361575 RepID=UPI00344B5E32